MYACCRLTIYQVLLKQVDTTLRKSDAKLEAAVNLPTKLSEYSNVFCLRKAEKLLPYRLYNYNIKLKDRQVPL